ncbi:MAG: 2-oxoacid:acceptor oxidoreductase family protein, partial [Alphaproteobacteria bacterium]|nr:2-oxoacid:acceptor oxidoreductase family protein [Alphaproteobacteria bacterium]
AEKRRRRKRGQFPDPNKRVFINAAVCEGCGDCSVQSNCVSVEPLETEFGRKRRINQSSCNKDFSCLKGFCPSFVTVEGASIKKAKAADVDTAAIPVPALQSPGDGYNVFVTGIGGTGVLTVSALLGMAAHLEGKSSTTADMAGLAQKGGAVYSHVRLAERDEHLLSPRIIAGAADLVLACDSVVAADRAAQNLMAANRTAVVANADVAPTSDFVRNRDLDFQRARIEKSIRSAANPNATTFIAADTVATALLGDAIGANVLMMGFAWQQGLIPLSLASLEGAMELNGVAIDFNKKAFALGRLLAHRPDQVLAMVEQARGPAPEPLSQTLDELIAKRVADLTAYQDAAYAARYRALVERVRQTGDEALAEAVARSYYKLLAYKDEYEVARLYSDGRFQAALEAQFGGDYRKSVQLSPPLFARTDPATGRPKKYSFGPWAFRVFAVLAKFKGLRGTALDPFGYTHERKAERQLIADYEASVDRLLAGLTADNSCLAVEIASVPMSIRGFGPVKEKAMTEAKTREAALWATWPGVAKSAAA